MKTTEHRLQGKARFERDGVGLEQIVAASGTPCYIYSAETIRKQFQKLAASFPGFLVCYSLKANPNPAICRLLAELGAGAEVSSHAELETALAAGFSPNDTIFVGPAKSRQEIELAVKQGIYAIVADSPMELEQVDAACRSAGKNQLVLARVNTLEKPQGREKMVGGPSKFGFDEETVVDQLRSVRLERTRIGGIQVYSASQVLDPGFLAGHLEYVLNLAQRLWAELRIPEANSPQRHKDSKVRTTERDVNRQDRQWSEQSKIQNPESKIECIDFGGGFGVPYSEDEPQLDLAPVAEAVRRLLAQNKDFLAGCRLLLESGRYLVAESGVFLTRVVRVKESRGKTFIITDAGMNAFSRPVFMRVRHPIRLLNKLAEPVAGRYEVCGPICTPLDCLGTDVLLPKPEPGDVVGIFNAGAYGYSMSLRDFMSLPHPLEFLSDHGRLTQIR